MQMLFCSLGLEILDQLPSASGAWASTFYYAFEVFNGNITNFLQR